jgi:hypothetical protein
MQIEGIVVQLLPEVTGEGKNGTWRKQEFILETGGKYPKRICIGMWGENIDQFALSQGQVITASIDIESREYKSRWYTDVKAWKIEGGTLATPAVSQVAQPPSSSVDNEDDGLPF